MRQERYRDDIWTIKKCEEFSKNRYYQTRMASEQLIVDKLTHIYPKGLRFSEIVKLCKSSANYVSSKRTISYVVYDLSHDGIIKKEHGASHDFRIYRINPNFLREYDPAYDDYQSHFLRLVHGLNETFQNLKSIIEKDELLFLPVP